jgi:hypothetical protein
MPHFGPADPRRKAVEAFFATRIVELPRTEMAGNRGKQFRTLEKRRTRRADLTEGPGSNKAANGYTRIYECVYCACRIGGTLGSYKGTQRLLSCI